ncbi:MAG: hypothetical protein GY795_00355 [Desulfobacterales bacterium]|nr:hypothetical protein [Desulfobacterales bacterium]
MDNKLIKKLESWSWRTRKAAVEALGKTDDPYAVQPLIRALKDKNSYVRRSAVEELGKTGDPCAVQPLIRALKDKDSYVRRSAAEELGKTGDPRALSPLIEALPDFDEHVRRKAAEALGDTGDSGAIDPLINILKSDNWNLRATALKALEKIDDQIDVKHGPPAGKRITKALNQTSYKVFITAMKNNLTTWDKRKSAVDALGYTGGPHAVRPLIEALGLPEDNYEYFNFRKSAVEALGRIGDIRAVVPLVNALKEKNEHIRNSAAKALGKIGDSRAVQSLVHHLMNDKNTIVRQSAAEALGNISDPAATEPLIDVLKDNYVHVRISAAEALVKIGGADVIHPLITALKDSYLYNTAKRALAAMSDLGAEQTLIDALEDKDYNIRTSVAEALGDMGSPNAAGPLAAALKDENESVREKAADALEKIRHPVKNEDLNAVADASSSIQPFINSLKNPCRNVRLKAIRVLERNGNQDEARHIITSLEDSHGSVRQRAAEALGNRADIPEAVQPLVAVLRKDDFLLFRSLPAYPYNIPLAVVRSSAATALGKICDPGTERHLIDALNDECTDVRESAAEALGKAGSSDAVKPLINALKDEDIFVRRNAAEALEKLGDPLAIQPLTDVLKDDTIVSSKADRAISAIVSSNKPLLNVSHHILCSNCFSKMEVTKIKAGALKEYTVRSCRHCSSWIHSIKNVSRVTGLIGGDIENYQVTNGNVYVNLWSETQKKARNADIDVLEIRDADNISYDYAVNAVLITLKNDASRSGEYVRQVPVVIHGNPRIPEGAMTILKHEFGVITNKPDR